MIKRVGRAALVAAGAGAAVIGATVMRARRNPGAEGFSADDISGTVGDGAPLCMAWIGDSTGSGVGATALDHVLPRVVAAGVGRRVSLHVLAQSGARTSDALVTQQPRLSDIHPDWVFIAVGTNDVIHLTPRSRFRAEFDLLLEAVLEEQPERVVVLGLGDLSRTPALPWALRKLAGARMRAFDADLRAAAARHGALYVDIFEHGGATFHMDPVRYHANDRFHPSDAGYALWAAATLDALAHEGLIASAS